MKLRKSWRIPAENGTLLVEESDRPDMVTIRMSPDKTLCSSLEMSRAAFEAMSRLATYSSYADSIDWCGKPAPEPQEDKE